MTRPPHAAVLGPLVGVVVAAAAGAVVGGHLPRAAALPIALQLTGLATVAGAGRVERSGARGALAMVAVLLTVAGMSAMRWDALGDGPLTRLAARGGAEAAVAVVVGEPRSGLDGSWSAVVRVERLGDTRLRVRALWRGRQRPPVVGSRWGGQLTARPLPDDDHGDWLRRQHVAVQVDPRDWRRLAPPGWAGRSSETVRQRLRAAAERGLPPARAGLAVGLVTGDTRLLPDEAQDAMHDTGLGHLIAVSGSNVALVVAGVLGACGALGLGLHARHAVVAVTVVWFAYLTRLEPSVLRAATMGGVVLLASLRGVSRQALHALVGAGLILLLADPFLAGSLGLVLSAAATGGVLVLSGPVRRRLSCLPGVRSGRVGGRGLADRLADVLAVTLGAQLAVAPALLAHAGQLPLSSVPANVVAVPAAATAATVAFPAALVALVDIELAAALLGLADPPLRLILATADALRGWGGIASWQRPTTVLAVALVGAWVVTRPGSRPSRCLAAAGAVALVAGLVPAVLGPPPVRDFLVTAIDVGQGDAILLETPGARVLVDAGRDETAADWLRRTGRDELDVAVVSHFDADHSGGMPAVLSGAEVAALWVGLVPGKRDAARDVLDLAAAGAIPVHVPSAGQRARVGDLLLEVLGPAAGRPYAGDDAEANEASLVVRASWGGRSVLLTGDVEEDAQRDLLAQPQRLRADVLKVPHHGAGGSLPEFLAAPHASVALVSVGADNDYGHPTRETLAALTGAGLEVRRTDHEGTIRVPVPATHLVAGRPALPDVAAGAYAGPDEPSRLPARRRRRAAAGSGARGPPRRAAHRRPRAGRGAVGRERDRPPARAADCLAVRRADLRHPARRRGVVR